MNLLDIGVLLCDVSVSVPKQDMRLNSSQAALPKESLLLNSLFRGLFMMDCGPEVRESFKSASSSVTTWSLPNWRICS